jgi:hypothetical protein
VKAPTESRNKMSDKKDNTYTGAAKGRFSNNNNRHCSKERGSNDNSGFKGETEDIEKHTTFFYGKGMADKCLVPKEKFIGYMGRKYGASEKQSLEQGVLTVVGAEKPKSIELKTEFEAMFFSDQEEWKHEMKRYKEMTAKTTTNNLSRGYIPFYGNNVIRPSRTRSRSIRDLKMLNWVVM